MVLIGATRIRLAQPSNTVDRTDPRSKTTMESPAQDAAHAAHPPDGTGARTDAGRDASSMNSTTHGLTAKKAFLPALAARIRAAIATFSGFYNPRNPVETELLVVMATASIQ